MYQKIVVPLDGSKRSELSLSLASQVAAKSGGALPAEIHLLVAITLDKLMFVDRDDTFPADFERLGSQQMEMALAYLEEVAGRLRAAGQTVVTEARQQAPAACIVEYAQEQGAQLIIMGSISDNSWSRWLSGSTTDSVLRHAPCPVLVVRPDPTPQSVVSPV